MKKLTRFGAPRIALCALAGAIVLGASVATSLAGQGGQVRLEVVDRDTKQPIACRMHLTNAAHRPLKAPKVPFFHDHFVFSGSITLKLPEGEYAFEIERGPEYLVRSGHFTMQNFSDDTKVVDLKRFADMSAEGWWSGDFDVARPAKDLQLLMDAEDLHVVELVTWPKGKNLLPKSSSSKNPLVQFDGNRFYHLSAGSDEGPGGRLLFFNLPEPLEVRAPRQLPSQLAAMVAARSDDGAWIDAPKISAWDLPAWVASGKIDSVQLASADLGRKTTANGSSGARPRDASLYPGPSGVGRWSETIYYHLLNCGLRIPPSAGSGSGNVANPLGYNRMYVHVDGALTYEAWWNALREGKVVVTNGPLIRPNVEGELPGHVFRASAGDEVELEVGLTLSTRDRISYLEIIKNGELAHQVRLAEWEKTGGKLPPLKFNESGWFLIRAVTDLSETYRFASTGPYYVEMGDRQRISRSSAQFFLDWLEERTKNLKFDDPKERDAVLKAYEQARAFWRGLQDRATVE